MKTQGTCICKHFNPDSSHRQFLPILPFPVMPPHQHDNYPQVTPLEGLHPIEQGEKEVWAYHHQSSAPPRYAPDNTPGRKIGGLTPWIFWTTIALISFVVVVASVGGAVGGTRVGKSEGMSCPTSTAQYSASSSNPSPISASTTS